MLTQKYINAARTLVRENDVSIIDIQPPSTVTYEKVFRSRYRISDEDWSSKGRTTVRLSRLKKKRYEAQASTSAELSDGQSSESSSVYRGDYLSIVTGWGETESIKSTYNGEVQQIDFSTDVFNVRGDNSMFPMNIGKVIKRYTESRSQYPDFRTESKKTASCLPVLRRRLDISGVQYDAVQVFCASAAHTDFSSENPFQNWYISTSIRWYDTITGVMVKNDNYSGSAKVGTNLVGPPSSASMQVTRME